MSKINGETIGDILNKTYESICNDKDYGSIFNGGNSGMIAIAMAISDATERLERSIDNLSEVMNTDFSNPNEYTCEICNNVFDIEQEMNDCYQRCSDVMEERRKD